jgi:hypothetical protein
MISRLRRAVTPQPAANIYPSVSPGSLTEGALKFTMRLTWLIANMDAPSMLTFRLLFYDGWPA